MIIHKVSQKFCNHSDIESGRKSATIHTLDVAEILQPLTDWMSKRFREKNTTLTVSHIWISIRIIA